MREAEELLVMINALDEQSHEITGLGKIIADLPTDPLLSKIIVESYFKNCSNEIISILSLLNCSEKLWIFAKNDEKKEKVAINKFEFCHESGDFMTFKTIMKEFELKASKNIFFEGENGRGGVNVMVKLNREREREWEKGEGEVKLNDVYQFFAKNETKNKNFTFFQYFISIN